MLASCLTALALALPVQQTTTWLDSFLQGNRALEEGRLKEAQVALEAALATVPEHAATAWGLAGVSALCGERDDAFRWLEQSIAWGGGEATLLEWDPDLAVLREDARFALMLAELRVRDSARDTDSFPLTIAFGANELVASPKPPVDVVLTEVNGHDVLYDLRAKETLAILEWPRIRNTWSSLSPDGRWVVTTGYGTSVLRVHDARTGDLLRELDHTGDQTRLQFSANGKRLLGHRRGSGAGSLVVWETDDWNNVSNLPDDFADNTLFSPDGSRVLAIGRSDSTHSTISIWSVDDQELIRRHSHVATIPNTEMGFSSDSKLAFVVENQSGAIVFYDAVDGKELSRSAPAEGHYRQAHFLGATGELAAKDRSRKITVINAFTGKIIREFESSSDDWTRFDASSDGELLLIPNYSGDPLHVYDPKAGEAVWSCDAGRAGARFSIQDTHVLIGNRDGVSSIRAARTGEVLATLTDKVLETVECAHPTRDQLWVGASDGSLRCVDVKTGRHTFVRQDSTEGIHSLAFDPTGRTLAAIDRAGTLFLIEAETGALKSTVLAAGRSEPRYWEKAAKFAADGSVVVVRASDTTLGIHTIESGLRTPIDVGEPFQDWSISRDAAFVAVGTREEQLILFDSVSGTRLRSLAIEDDIASLAFEREGKTLWVGTRDSTLISIDVATAEIRRTLRLRPHDEYGDGINFSNMALSSNGNLGIAVSSGSATVVAWNPETAEDSWDYQLRFGNPSTLFCEFGGKQDRVYIWGQGPWSPRIIEPESGKTLLNLADRDIDRIHPLADERFVAVTTPRGLEVLDTERGGSRWARFDLADEGWLISATSNHFDGTSAAIQSTHIALDDRSYPLDALATALIDPKRVRAAADGVTLFPARLPAIPQLTWGDVPPRVIELNADERSPAVSLHSSCSDGIETVELSRDGVRWHISPESLADLVLEGPAPGGSVDYRIRAMSSRGVLSRALHVTIQRSR